MRYAALAIGVTINYVFHFNRHGLAMYRLRNSVCLSAIYLSLSRQRHDILDFSCCSQPRVLHVTLTNSTFGFELHLRSIPCPFSRQLAIVLIVIFFWLFLFCFFCCQNVLTRLNQVKTVDHVYNSWLSIQTPSTRCLYQTRESSI